jgi:hypothetical protein
MAPTDVYFKNSYGCVKIDNNKVIPYAQFNNVDSFMAFIISRIEPNLGRIGNTTLEEDITEYLIRYYPYDAGLDDAGYEKFKKLKNYKDILGSIKDALKSAQASGINALTERKKTNLGDGDVTTTTEEC